MFGVNNEDIKYLSGETFSSVYHFKIAGTSKPRTRIELLKEILPGKNALHLGCVDHLPLIAYRRQKGMWLHEIMSDICASVVGIDINEEGIRYMNDAGFESYVSNVITDEPPSAVSSKKWDYIVAGEVLEHIDDPVAFLKAIRERYGKFTDRIIITVPNAFSYTNFRFSLRNTEMINSDHRFWFTPFTLMKVAMQAGIQVEGFDLCIDEPAPLLSFKIWLIKYRPLFRNRVVLIGKL